MPDQPQAIAPRPDPDYYWARYIADRLRARLRDIFEENRERPPAFIRARVERACVDQAMHVILTFEGARYQHYVVKYPYEELARDGVHHRAFDHRDIDRFCRQYYSEIVEDAHVERELRVYHAAFETLVRMNGDPAQIAQMADIIREREEHVRRHHRARQDYEFYRGHQWTIDEVDRAYRRVRARPPTPVAPLGMVAAEMVRPDGIIETIDYRDFYRDVYIDPGVPDRAPSATEIRMRHRMEQLVRHEREEMRHYIERNLFLQYHTDFIPFGNPEAQAKGLELLKRNLSPNQLKEYEAHKHFHVVGCDTRTRYRIKHGRHSNIDVLDRQGHRTHGICFIPQGNLVEGDCMLAQKIDLETDELAALKVANRQR